MNSRSFSPLILLTVLTFLASCAQGSDTIRNSSMNTRQPSSIAQVNVTPSANATTTGTTKTSQISYSVPDGTSSTDFSLTVTDGVVSDASAATISGDRESQQYQNRFARKIENAVVGKKISELNLHSIGGASLTTRAFEQFVTSSF